MKHSYYDDEHKLFIACVECKRGYYGQRDCSAGRQHEVFKGQGCFIGELIRPKCSHGESSEKCPFINNRDGDCLNDDGTCDTYSYDDMALKQVNDEMYVLAVRKNCTEKEYKKLIEECDKIKVKINQFEGRIKLLMKVDRINKRASSELAVKWNELDKIVRQKSKEKSELK
jgi:hypothetical protein